MTCSPFAHSYLCYKTTASMPLGAQQRRIQINSNLF